jgi:hypothetical protein
MPKTETVNDCCECVFADYEIEAYVNTHELVNKAENKRHSHHHLITISM